MKEPKSTRKESVLISLQIVTVLIVLSNQSPKPLFIMAMLAAQLIVTTLVTIIGKWQ